MASADDDDDDDDDDLLTLTLIQPASVQINWVKLRRHSCLLRAATSSSFQASSIPGRS